MAAGVAAARLTAWLLVAGLSAVGLSVVGGCGPRYEEVRLEGIEQMSRHRYVPARQHFLEADAIRTNEAENLYDLGFCSLMLARERIDQGNEVAALSELDRAIEFFDRAIDAYPGFQPALEGKNIALELKGDPDAALDQAKWAVRVLGPSARQYLFLAGELEQRGQIDEAHLRYGQAVRMEPTYAPAHTLFARFLLKQGYEPAAVAHLKKSFALDPRQPWVREQLAKRGALPAPRANRP